MMAIMLGERERVFTKKRRKPFKIKFLVEQQSRYEWNG